MRQVINAGQLDALHLRANPRMQPPHPAAPDHTNRQGGNSWIIRHRQHCNGSAEKKEE
jgi:hypothetical protein